MGNWVFRRPGDADQVVIATGYDGSTDYTIIASLTGAGAAIPYSLECSRVNANGTVVWTKNYVEDLNAFDANRIAAGIAGGNLWVVLSDVYATAGRYHTVKLSLTDGSVLGGQRVTLGNALMMPNIAAVVDALNPTIVGWVNDDNDAQDKLYVAIINANGSVTTHKTFTVPGNTGLILGPDCCSYISAYTRLLLVGRRTDKTFFYYQVAADTLADQGANYLDMTSAAGTIALNNPPSIIYNSGQGAGYIAAAGNLWNMTSGRLQTGYTGLPAVTYWPSDGNGRAGFVIGASTSVLSIQTITDHATSQPDVYYSSGAMGLTLAADSATLVPASARKVTNNTIVACNRADNGHNVVMCVPYTYNSGLAGTYDGVAYGARTDTAFTVTNAIGLTSLTTAASTLTAPTQTTTNMFAYTDALTPTVTQMVATTNGSITKNLPKITASLTGASSISGTIAKSLPKITGVLADQTVTATMAAPTPKITATLTLQKGDNIDSPLPRITGALAGMDVFAGSIPRITASLTLDAPNYGTTAKTLPKVTAALDAVIPSVMTVARNLPRVTAAFEGSVSGILETSATLPKITAAIEGGAQTNDMTLPAVTGSLDALTAVLGNIDSAVPKPTAAIDAQSTASATMDAVLTRVQSNVEAVAGLIGSITGLARPIAGTLAGATTTAGGIAAVLPVVEFSTSAATTTYGSIGARLPRTPYGELVARMALVHALTHVMNTVSTAVTVFENYQFNSFAKIGGKYYAADDTGLHRIDDGKLDKTAAIQWAIQTGLLDFRSAMQKRMSDFYLAMRSEGDVTLTVSTDELDPYEYSLKPYEIETLKQRRDLIGKGMRGRYWQFGLSGDSDFDMDAYNMAVVDTARRI